MCDGGNNLFWLYCFLDKTTCYHLRVSELCVAHTSGNVRPCSWINVELPHQGLGPWWNNCHICIWTWSLMQNCWIWQMYHQRNSETGYIFEVLLTLCQMDGPLIKYPMFPDDLNALNVQTCNILLLKVWHCRMCYWAQDCRNCIYIV
jgi:hypothetical protein